MEVLEGIYRGLDLEGLRFELIRILFWTQTCFLLHTARECVILMYVIKKRVVFSLPFFFFKCFGEIKEKNAVALERWFVGI